MSQKRTLNALPRSGEPVTPGPPDFGEVEGGPHHPGAATTPGAGPNPTPLPPSDEHDPDETSPGAATVPGAGPNPGVG